MLVSRLYECLIFILRSINCPLARHCQRFHLCFSDFVFCPTRWACCFWLALLQWLRVSSRHCTLLCVTFLHCSSADVRATGCLCPSPVEAWPTAWCVCKFTFRLPQLWTSCYAIASFTPGCDLSTSPHSVKCVVITDLSICWKALTCSQHDLELADWLCCHGLSVVSRDTKSEMLHMAFRCRLRCRVRVCCSVRRKAGAHCCVNAVICQLLFWGIGLDFCFLLGLVVL